MIRSADWIVDLGPQAGEEGGYLIFNGKLPQLYKTPQSLTALYLTGKKEIPTPKKRRNPQNWLILKNVKKHNLKDITVKIPLGVFVCITGVSGSGKSTLLQEVLYPSLEKRKPINTKKIQGLEYIDRVLYISQAPIGRTPRSNPATYTGVFTPIRELFASLPLSKMRGYKPGRFSFNVPGGRCDACEGDGVKKIEMHFLEDVYITCEICQGKRFNRETLEVRYKGKNIYEVLEMSVEEAYQFFYPIPSIREKLEYLKEVGLGYIKLGQPATTLSGGEAQRVKLAKELARKSRGNTLYLLDEPTTGLHFEDIKRLLNILHRFVEEGNTVIVIEHNMEVIKNADWIIDLGPEGGEKGGYVVAEGTPEEVSRNPQSITGKYLEKWLKKSYTYN